MSELTPYDRKTLENGALNLEGEDDDPFACVDDYPEHDYQMTGEADGWQTFVCRRCGAEIDERA